ncbi:MAG: HAMP domain-containing histidine kinase [Coriobacteriia bacterium]|nr:HAMP domain-containing histidine kinase [Coriobacteriia bacterium]
MHRSSLRRWLFLVSALVALVFVSVVAVTGYLVVSRGMETSAERMTLAIAEAAAKRMKGQVTDAKISAALRGVPLENRDAEAERQVMRSIQDLRTGDTALGEFALYGPDDELYWYSGDAALVGDHRQARRTALDQHRTIAMEHEPGHLLTGLFFRAELGNFIVHVPFDLPGGKRAVLDVVYDARREEAVVDALRRPMAGLAIVTMFASVLMMQVTVGLVLSRVDVLREAADSIDAGQLDVRLPDMGHNEVGDLARSLNKLVGRLQQRSATQARFVADASHELATPVAGIRGYVNILRVWGADDLALREEAIKAIDRESRRMARLTADLLSLIRSGQASEFKQERFDLNVRAREVLAAAATRYLDKGLDFVGPEEGQLMMVGDPERIEDAVSILVDNAAKFTPSGGRVQVATRRKREDVVVEVSDTGQGISEEDLASIFERFYRADSSRSKQTGGFGLGLSIAKRIVETSGGRMEVRSTVGQGSTFVVRLPRGRT